MYAPRSRLALLTLASLRLWGPVHASPAGIAAVLAAPPDWAVSIQLQGSQGGAVTLTFGVAVDARPGLDPTYGEIAIAPGALPARFRLAADVGGPVSFQAPADEVVWALEIEPDQLPASLAWDQAGLPQTGSLFLSDLESGGARLALDMRQVGGIGIADAQHLTQLVIVYRADVPDTRPPGVEWSRPWHLQANAHAEALNRIPVAGDPDATLAGITVVLDEAVAAPAAPGQGGAPGDTLVRARLANAAGDELAWNTWVEGRVIRVYRARDQQPRLERAAAYVLTVTGVRDRAGNEAGAIRIAFATVAGLTSTVPLSSWPHELSTVDPRVVEERGVYITFLRPIGLSSPTARVATAGWDEDWVANVRGDTIWVTQPGGGESMPLGQLFVVSVETVAAVAGPLGEVRLHFYTAADTSGPTPTRVFPAVAASDPAPGGLVDPAIVNARGIRVWFSEGVQTTRVQTTLTWHGPLGLDPPLATLEWEREWVGDSVLVLRPPREDGVGSAELGLGGHYRVRVANLIGRFGNVSPAPNAIDFRTQGEVRDLTAQVAAAAGEPPGLDRPADVYVDAEGRLFVVDGGNARVRRLDGDGQLVTVAGQGGGRVRGDGGAAVAAGLGEPRSICADGAGALYIAGSQRVRRVAPDGTIRTVAGTGESAFRGDGGFATDAGFRSTESVFIDRRGDLFITDRIAGRVRRVDANSGIITTAVSGLEQPLDAFVTDDGLTYVAAAGQILRYAASSQGPERLLQLPLAAEATSLFVTADGNVFVGDSHDGVRRLDPRTGELRTVLSGFGEMAVFVDRAGWLYVTMAQTNKLFAVADVGTPTPLSPGVHHPALSPAWSWPAEGDTVSAQAVNARGVAFVFPQSVVPTGGAARLRADDGAQVEWVVVMQNDTLRVRRGAASAPLVDGREYLLELPSLADAQGIVEPRTRLRFATAADTAPRAGEADPAVVLDFDLTPGDQGVRQTRVPPYASAFDLQLLGHDLPEISGWSALIEYDHLRLTPGDFRPSDRLPGIVSLVDVDAGTVEVGGSVLGTSARVSGSVELGVLTFRLRARLDYPLSLAVSEIRLRLAQGGTLRLPTATGALVLPGLPVADAEPTLRLDFDAAPGDQGVRLITSRFPGETQSAQLHLNGDGLWLQRVLAVLECGEELTLVDPHLAPAVVGEVRGAFAGGSRRLEFDLRPAAGAWLPVGSLATLSVSPAQTFRGRSQVRILEARAVGVDGSVRAMGGSAVTVSQQASAVVLDLDPATGNQQQKVARGVTPGERVVVQLFAVSVRAINGWSTAIDFSPIWLHYVPGSFTPGPFVPGLVALVDDEDPGRVIVGGTVLGTDGVGVGSGLVGSLEFETAEAFGEETDLIIAETALRLPNGEVEKLATPDRAVLQARVFRPEVVLDLAANTAGDQGQRLLRGVMADQEVEVELYATDLPVIRGWSVSLVLQGVEYVRDSFRPEPLFIPGLVPLVAEAPDTVRVGGTLLGGTGTGSGDATLGRLRVRVPSDFNGYAEIGVVELALNQPGGNVRKVTGRSQVALVSGLLAPGEGCQECTFEPPPPVYPVYEISDADLAGIDLHDGTVEDWVRVFGRPSLLAADFTPEGIAYDPADLDFRMWFGFNTAAGKLCLAVERIDDIYLNDLGDGPLAQARNHDGTVEILIDGDRSGGAHAFDPDCCAQEEERDRRDRYAQHYVAVPRAGDGATAGVLGKGSQWVNALPYTDGGGSVRQEEGAVVSVVEFCFTPFDTLRFDDPEGSVKSNLAPGRLLAFDVLLADGDHQAGRREGLFTLSGWFQNALGQLLGYGATAVGQTPAGFEIALHQSYPNPFNAMTVIAYELDRSCPVALVVYDLAGQVVRRLVAESQPAGRYRVTWDGRDGGGQAVASGVYVYQLAAGQLRLVRKLALVR